jgi:hypothetical protein
MPLFFLISGFFGRMMLEKYGVRRYLAKRWHRIGVPLIVGMFTFGPAYILTRDALSSRPGPGGPSGAGMPGPPGGQLPPPPPGFVPAHLAQFDEDADGSLSDAEWTKARGNMGRMFGGGPPPGFGPGGPLRGGPFGASGGGLSERLFGTSARLFHLNHLWFLWYLLVFATAAPCVVGALDRLLPQAAAATIDQLGGRLLRSGFGPVILGVLYAPALMLSSGPFGWSLGLPGAIFLGFPDFLWHLDPEMAFYSLSFLAGWWLHRERDALPSLARGWASALTLGLAAFAAATWLSDSYAAQRSLPHYALLRWLGFTLYGIASAAMGFAFLGFFLRHFDRPSPTWRYLADTALWVYLVHQPLVVAGLSWLGPLRLPWWALTAAVSAISSAEALLLYEAVVRPTPLVRLFGPVSVRSIGTGMATSEPEDRGGRDVGR